MIPDLTRQKLFVEGPSDGAVVNALVRARLGVDLGNPKGHRIVDAPPEEGGFFQALNRFKSALASRRPERLGLVVDRDGTPDRWNAVRGALSELSHPEVPPSSGVRLSVAWGRVGVWLMPDNVSSGDLEVFLERILPDPPPQTWPHAEEATRTARQLGAPFQEKHFAKARLHTWLAWNDPPGLPYGTALTAGAFRPENPTAEGFLDWFKWLYG